MGLIDLEMAEERVNEFENRNYPILRTERKIMMEK